MPELPEVETVKEILKEKLIGKIIIGVNIYYKNIIKTECFIDNVINKKIIDITRRGKFLIFHLDDLYLVSHLRMEGKYFIKNTKNKILTHEHIVFHLNNGYDLRYNDTRKFGTMHILKSLDELPLSKLGPEPFCLDINILPNCKRSIKTVLLDQTVIAGIGNIYADEICFLANVHPKEITCNLTLKQKEKIITSIPLVLEKAISLGGTTIRSYTSSLGVTGRFQNELNVHTKKRCLKCNTKIEKIKVGGRGTYFCPVCQKENEL